MPISRVIAIDNAKPDVLLLVSAVPEMQNMLAARYTVHAASGAAAVEKAVRDVGPRIRAIVTMSKGPVGRDLIERLPALEMIAVSGGHLDVIDRVACAERNIAVSYTPKISGPDVADLAIVLMLDAARGIAASDRYVRAGRWAKEGAMPLAKRISGAKLGILGMGYIGRMIAERAQGFGMAISYCASRRHTDVPYRHVPDVLTLAKENDVLIVAAATTPETRGLVDARVLEALGPDGILVNICRSIVDEKALIAALENRTIFAAATDVFEDEPRVPEAFLKLDNVVLTSHIGSATRASRQGMADRTLANIDAHFAGRPLPDPAPAEGH